MFKEGAVSIVEPDQTYILYVRYAFGKLYQSVPIFILDKCIFALSNRNRHQIEAPTSLDTSAKSVLLPDAVCSPPLAAFVGRDVVDDFPPFLSPPDYQPWQIHWPISKLPSLTPLHMVFDNHRCQSVYKIVLDDSKSFPIPLVFTRFVFCFIFLPFLHSFHLFVDDQEIHYGANNHQQKRQISP